MLQKYPKFKIGEDCAFPKRDNCNYDEYDIKSQRCPYMKCITVGCWHCIYKKQSKSELNKKELKGADVQ